MTEEQEIGLDEAAKQLGVTKGTLHYYIRTLKIKTKKYPLDRRAYMLLADFETIRALKERASRGRTQEVQGQEAA